MSKTDDTTPLARMLEGEAAQKWTVTGAISELIDNSLGDARGDASEVLIIYDKRERKLTIRDNGKGIAERIKCLFQIGRTVGISPTDIGVRGMGGTKALIWLADKVSIHTMCNGKVNHDIVRWQDHVDSGQFPQTNAEWVEPNGRTPAALKDIGHGTHIDLWLRPGRAIKEDQIQRELARTYSCGLRHGKKIQWMTITSQHRDYLQTLKGETFPLPSDKSKMVKLKLTVLSDDAGPLQAQGVVALVDDHPYKDSLVTVGFGHRAIMSTRKCYTNADGTRSYGGAGVVGYIDLIGGGWKPKLTTTKDDFDDARVFDALMQQIFVCIEPLLQQTERNRFQVVLSELALDLTAAFNGLNDPDFNLGGEGEGGHGAGAAIILRDDSVRPLPNNVRPFKPHTPRVVDPTRKGPYPGGNQRPPASRLELLPVPDRDIDGLCRLEIRSPHDTNLRVEINKDHEVVDELLKPKAVNKMALAVMITREVAAALVRQPLAMEHVLSKRLREKLETAADDFARERMLARLLMDSVKRPQITEAVA